MPLLETKGAASAQGFGLTLGGAERVFIEDVMSVFLYTGNGSTQTITNGIDLSGKGGLVWLASRNPLSSAYSHQLYDTARGPNGVFLQSFDTAGANFQNGNLTGFLSSGFSLGAGSGSGILANYPTSPNNDYVSWTFRKQPKFFDVVTYTGNGASNRQIAHGLGSTPGCVIVKCTSTSASWAVWHRSIGSNEYLYLNSTIAATTDNTIFGGSPTATTFTVAGGGANVATNQNGATYVAYLFAHDAGGFGLSGTDNVISCGSFTTDGSGNATVTLGYEPQWLLTKRTGTTGDWLLHDVMRGFNESVGSTDTGDAILRPNTSGAETNGSSAGPTATGFKFIGAASEAHIYIAIRRGPMRVPTSGTSVYNAIARTGTGATATVSGFGFPLDTFLSQTRSTSTSNAFIDRLRGGDLGLSTQSTAGDSTGNGIQLDRMDGYVVPNASNPFNYNGTTVINWGLRRAPGFFDVVCYTGNGGAQNVNHNLRAIPELIIVKNRAGTIFWPIYSSALGNTAYLRLNTTDTPVSVDMWDNSTPTATTFRVGAQPASNGSGDTYVAYLFASCPGVSKVFSYTGNGSSQTINCGFTGGARFVLIKRTDSTGDWYVWDSARGIVAANDPHLSLNTTAAEVTTDDSVDTDNTGFVVNQVAATNINVSSATYIGLAVA